MSETSIAMVLKKAIFAIILTFPLTQLALSDREMYLVWLLAMAIVLDSLLGIISAIMMQRFSSWNLGQPMAKKVMRYGFAISACFIAAKSHIALYWAMEYMTVYLILSEVVSVFEKLALLGFKLPTKILSKVNVLFEEYSIGKRDRHSILMKKDSEIV